MRRDQSEIAGAKTPRFCAVRSLVGRRHLRRGRDVAYPVFSSREDGFSLRPLRGPSKRQGARFALAAARLLVIGPSVATLVRSSHGTTGSKQTSAAHHDEGFYESSVYCRVRSWWVCSEWDSSELVPSRPWCRSTLIGTGFPLRGSGPNPLIVFREMIGRTGCCARRVLVHDEHSPPSISQMVGGQTSHRNSGLAKRFHHPTPAHSGSFRASLAKSEGKANFGWSRLE